MNALERILKWYGQRLTVISDGETRETCGFLQPDMARTEREQEEQSAIGWVDTRIWRYIGAEMVQPEDVVVWHTLKFRVRSSRAYCLGDGIHHWQATLEREREAAR